MSPWNLQSSYEEETDFQETICEQQKTELYINKGQMGKSDGRMYILCSFDIPLLVFVELSLTRQA